MIPNKLAYFSQGSTYRTYKEEEDVSENTISFVGDDLSVATQGKIFGVRGVYPGTCTTAAATAAKVATTTPLFPLDSNGKPLPGTTIAIKFSNSNTYKTAGTTMTLDVNSTGAYPIYYNNAEVVSTTSANTAACGYKNRYTFYIFNGTQWVWLSYGTDSNTTYDDYSFGLGYGVQDNESESSTITVTLGSYKLKAGPVGVNFIYNVPASSTMNINSLGAKGIYYRGAAITSGIIKAGDLATFIYNKGDSKYHLISIDRWQEDIDDLYSTKADSSSLATVATSGSYNDLLNKPTIPTATTVDSTWVENSTNPVESQLIQNAFTSLESYIPVNISDLNDDIGIGKVVYGQFNSSNGNFYPGGYNGPNGSQSFINSPVTPDTTTVYIDISSHKSYHYNGSSYVRIDDELQTLPTIGTLNTNNSTAQTASSSESFSNSINLHRISKTGSYTDLNNIPIVVLDSITTTYEETIANIGKKFFAVVGGRDKVVEIVTSGSSATSTTQGVSDNVIYYSKDTDKFYRYETGILSANGQMIEIGSVDISGKADLNGNEEELFTANGLYVTAWADYTKGINIDDNYNSTTQKNTLEFTDGVGTLSYTFGNTSEVIATKSDLNNLGTVTSTAITSLTDIL